MPSASPTAFVMNQNWSESSFPKPLKMGNFTEFTILNGGGGGGSVGEVYETEVKMEVLWVGVVFVGTLTLLTR